MNKTYKYQLQNQTPDYDFGDEVLYSQPETKKSGDNDIKVLVWMCLIAVLVLSSFAMIQVIPGAQFKIGALFSSMGMTEHPGYELGNVKLGTTMDVLRETQPQAQKSITANGSIALSFNEDDANYVVWYGEDGPYHIAYKARQNRIVTGMSEDEFISKITTKYGAPSVSTCTQRLMDDVRDCRYSWWMPGELRLDLISRQSTNTTNGANKLSVTLTATDTRLEGRIRRANLTTTRNSN